MNIKDVNSQKVRDYILKNNPNAKYRGWKIGMSDDGSIEFRNDDYDGYSIFISPLWEDDQFIDVSVFKNGENIQSAFDLYRSAEIEDAISKSEDQRTLNKRIEKIFLSSADEIIDDSIRAINQKKEEESNDEKKSWFIIEDISPGGVKSYEIKELSTKEEESHYQYGGPFETKKEAEKVFKDEGLSEDHNDESKLDHKYYIVSKGRILSGWEYKEDARDALKELPPVRRSESRVVSKRDMTIDVSDDGNWGDDDIDESEIIRNAREEFEFDAKSRFRDSGTENLILEIRAVDNKIVMDWYLKEISKKMSEAIGMGLNGVYNALNTKHQHAFEVFLAMKKPGKTNPLTPKIEKVLPDYLIKIWFLDHENNKKRTGEKFVGYIDANSMSEDKQTREVSFHVYGENTTMDGDVIDSEIMLSMTGKQFKDLTENGNSIAEDPNAEQMAEIFIVKKGEFKKRVKK